jgi:hypothetical protein
MRFLLQLAAAAAIITAAPAMAQSYAAVSMAPVPVTVDTVLPGHDLDAAPPIVLVAEGCGPGRWRGPWGGCRGPGPGAWYAPPPVYYGGNGCPPGSWRGPWGHCRDTPYHGRLPDGGWR